MSVELPLSTKIFPINPSNNVNFDDPDIIGIRRFLFEILFSESDWDLRPFWSRSWTVINDSVHRSEVIVSLLLSFEFHGWPSCDWHDCP
jgi:hypothetical protein